MTFKPTQEQQALLAHDTTRPARILAGPGTGKSTTMVALIHDLLTVDPDRRIKFLTFTRAATAELAEKVSEQTSTSERPSTIHSFAISVLMRNPGAGGFPEPLRIADDWEQREVLRPTLAKRARVKLKKLDALLQEMASNWESLSEQEEQTSESERARFLGAWNEHRAVYGYTLLAELPYALHRALRDHRDLSGLDYDLFLVDEYQDLNACDLAILKQLSTRGSTIIATGDDDQSIYSFRRAHPEGIRRFLSDYPDAGDYPLSITLRCGAAIVRWANFVIGGDPDRPESKPPLTPLEGSPAGEVALLSFKSHRAEAKGAVSLVRGLIEEEGLKPSDILILIRTDHHGRFSGPLKEELARNGIEYADSGSVGQILEEPENRKLIELLRLLVNRGDSVAWASLLRLTKGIGDKFCEHVYDQARAQGTNFAEILSEFHKDAYPNTPRGAAERSEALVSSATAWLEAQEPPDVRPDDGWGGWIAQLVADDCPATPAPALIQLLVQLDELSEERETLGRYLSQMQPLAKDLAAARSEGVRVMTMGMSKGLTVEATIICGLENDLVPHPKGDLSEERRILYVAMTRARRFLFGTWARRRKGQTARSGSGKTRQARTTSPFLEGGPVVSRAGEDFITSRFKKTDK